MTQLNDILNLRRTKARIFYVMRGSGHVHSAHLKLICNPKIQKILMVLTDSFQVKLHTLDNNVTQTYTYKLVQWSQVQTTTDHDC
jgi:hypothetical protein